MTNLDRSAPTQDERVLAGLAHISALLPMMGVIAPIIIWVTQKEKSRFVAFQSLQALAYQLSMIAAWFVGMGCYMCSFFATFITIPFAASGGPRPMDPFVGAAFFIPFAVFGAIFLGGFAFVVYGVVGAIMAFQGRAFRYLIIGERVERFMQQKPAATADE